MTIESFSAPRPPTAFQGTSAFLLMSGRPSASGFVGDEADFAPPQLERMALACLRSVEAALIVVDDWRQSGHGLEDLYIHGFAPCARLLGHWWRYDQLDFAQVTMASYHLQRVLHRLSAEFCAPGADQPAGLSLLLATEPQSQHTLGAFMLSEFFRRRGWTVQLITPQDGEDVLGHLRRDWYDAAALSISTGRQLQALAQWLPDVRAQSPNPHLHVMVGGPLAVNEPHKLEALGMDLARGDARETVNWISQQIMQRRS